MIVNPFLTTFEVVAGTRMLMEDFSLVGNSFMDAFDSTRYWRIERVYAPIKTRRLGGIRAKLIDQKGFITFCNQRDLELLLGLAKPGNMCPWTNDEYPEYSSPLFHGLCVDGDDLWDDLYDRELEMRFGSPDAYQSQPIPHGTQIVRHIHKNLGEDVEELDMMLYDCDPQTGLGPDTRFATIEKRWTRVQREQVYWETFRASA